MHRRPSISSLFALVCGALALASMAWAAIPTPEGEIQTCYADDSGALRVIDEEGECAEDETPLSWGAGGGASGGPTTKSLQSAVSGGAPAIEGAAASFVVSIDGQRFSKFTSAEGCGERAVFDTERDPVTGQPVTRVRPGVRQAERCRLSMNLPPETVKTWVAHAAAGTSDRRTIEIQGMDGDGRLLPGGVRLTGAFVTRLFVSDLDSFARGIELGFTLEVQPTEVGPLLNASTTPPAVERGSDLIRSDTFVVTVAGRPAHAVAVSSLDLRVQARNDATVNGWRRFKPGAATWQPVHVTSSSTEILPTWRSMWLAARTNTNDRGRTVNVVIQDANLAPVVTFKFLAVTALGDPQREILSSDPAAIRSRSTGRALDPGAPVVERYGMDFSLGRLAGLT